MRYIQRPGVLWNVASVFGKVCIIRIIISFTIVHFFFFTARWRIVFEERKCRYLPPKVSRLAYVTAALHNICCHFKVPLTERSSVNTNEIEETRSFPNETPTAITIRDRIRDEVNFNIG